MENAETTENALPDPTADLHWSNFVGPIHDIFAKNATRFPGRCCVIETESKTSMPTTPQREFTYQQIHEASNVVAHHFLQRGIERGEVIMIYAYRGVDLVISILAVLKAGATFSVVDPAYGSLKCGTKTHILHCFRIVLITSRYPPDRQIIYLDVARPRGLIVIEKASKEEGRLSDQVREWIKENLELRAELPGLELLDDGIVMGGSLDDDGQDVLLHQQSLKSKHPGVIVGPDSAPTLSFTSGSEGRPKGVLGYAHFGVNPF